MTAPARRTHATERALAHAVAFARRHGEIERFPGRDITLGLVSADHLLLGVAHPDVRADIWGRLGLNPAEVHDTLARALTVGIWPPPPTDATENTGGRRPDPTDMLLDASAQEALEYAAAEARRLKSPTVRTEHLLLGALRGPETLGRLALTGLGVTLTAVFAVLLTAESEAPD